MGSSEDLRDGGFRVSGFRGSTKKSLEAPSLREYTWSLCLFVQLCVYVFIRLFMHAYMLYIHDGHAQSETRHGHLRVVCCKGRAVDWKKARTISLGTVPNSGGR